MTHDDGRRVIGAREASRDSTGSGFGASAPRTALRALRIRSLRSSATARRCPECGRSTAGRRGTTRGERTRRRGAARALRARDRSIGVDHDRPPARIATHHHAEWWLRTRAVVVAAVRSSLSFRRTDSATAARHLRTRRRGARTGDAGRRSVGGRCGACDRRFSTERDSVRAGCKLIGARDRCGCGGRARPRVDDRVPPRARMSRSAWLRSWSGDRRRGAVDRVLLRARRAPRLLDDWSAERRALD